MLKGGPGETQVRQLWLYAEGAKCARGVLGVDGVVLSRCRCRRRRRRMPPMRAPAARQPHVASVHIL
eukprot:2158523-Prymnesium_polylepis.1